MGNGDDPYSEEQRQRDKKLDAKAKLEANENADQHLANLQALEARSTLEPVIFRGCSSLPEPVTRALSSSDKYAPVYAIYHDRLYSMNGPFTDEEFSLLTFRQFEKEMRFFTGLETRKKDIGVSSPHKRERLGIPVKVRREVWNRDGGKCVQCSNNQNLEFDHIIPVAKGGSSTVRNVQLLCAVCNGSKSDQI